MRAPELGKPSQPAQDWPKAGLATGPFGVWMIGDRQTPHGSRTKPDPGTPLHPSQLKLAGASGAWQLPQASKRKPELGTPNARVNACIMGCFTYRRSQGTWNCYHHKCHRHPRSCSSWEPHRSPRRSDHGWDRFPTIIVLAIIVMVVLLTARHTPQGSTVKCELGTPSQPAHVDPLPNDHISDRYRFVITYHRRHHKHPGPCPRRERHHSHRTKYPGRCRHHKHQ